MSPATRATVSRLAGHRYGDANVSLSLPDSPPANGSDTVDAVTTGRRALPRIARLLGPLVGLFFLVYPIQVVLAADPTPTRVFLALGGAALFAGVFLWLIWLHEPLQLVPAEPFAIRKYRAAIAFLTVLAIALSFILSQEWRVLFFHLNVAAGIMLLSRDAYKAIAVLAVIQVVVGIPTGLWWLVVPMAAIGLWGTAFVGQVATVAELRAAREELARRAVAEERLRFARDLHDLLGHSLSLITLKNELAGKLLPGAPERAAREVREAEEVARRALREVREAVSGYRQPTLGEELIGAREMLAAAGIACRIESGAGPLPRPVDALLAWAVREGVTNVIRHSHARRCSIRTARGDGAVTAEVSNDGRGSPPARKAAGGSGLAGLAERVADVAGAAFEAGPLPEGGFRLRVSLPLDGSTQGGAQEKGSR